MVAAWGHKFICSALSRRGRSLVFSSYVTWMEWRPPKEQKHQRGNAWLCVAANCSLCLPRVIKVNLARNQAPCYSVPRCDVLGGTLSSVVVFPKTPNALAVMRKHQTNPNQGSFYKVPSQNFSWMSRSWETRKSPERLARLEETEIWECMPCGVLEQKKDTSENWQNVGTGCCLAG